MSFIRVIIKKIEERLPKASILRQLKPITASVISASFDNRNVKMKNFGYMEKYTNLF